MARTRIISASQAVFTSPTGLMPSFYNASFADSPKSGINPTQLHRVDTVSFDTDLAGARQDVREFGQAARIAVVRTSEVFTNLSFGYYLTNGENESHMGLNIAGTDDDGAAVSQFISGIQTENPFKRERNLYILAVNDGTDAFASATYASDFANHDVIAFGNAGITNYSASMSVGEIPRADVDWECGNHRIFVGGHSGFANPSIDKTNGGPADAGLWALAAVPSTGNTIVDVLQPGDITVTFSSTASDIGGVDLSDICIQSATIDVPLSRTPLECLGSNVAVSRPLDVPINATLSLTANVKDFAAGTLENVLTGTTQGASRNITLTLKDRVTKQPQLVYLVKGLVLDSQSFSQGLDDNMSVDLTFSTQLGGATSTSNGVFVSGAYRPATQGGADTGVFVTPMTAV